MDNKNKMDNRRTENLLEYCGVIKKRRKLILLIVFIVTLCTAIYSLTIPKTYLSETLIMPLEGSGKRTPSSFITLAAGMNALPFLGGGLSGTPARQLMVLLKSWTLAEAVVNKYDLKKVLFKDRWEGKNKQWKDGKEPTIDSAADSLRGYVNISDDKKVGTVSVSVEFTDPKLAAIIANGYVESLQEYISANSFSMGKKNRIFIEEQLAKSKRDLLEVGKELNEFYKDGRVSNVESRVNVLLDTTDNHVFGNEDLVVEDNVSYENQLDVLEAKKSEMMEKLDNVRVVENVPQQVYLRYLTLRRELLGNVNTLLTQQYELAKIEEVKEDLAFQVVDPARVPLKRFKPQRRKMVMIAFAASLFIALFFAFLLEYLEEEAGVKIEPRSILRRIPVLRRYTAK